MFNAAAPNELRLRTDALSGEIFRSKLQAIMAVREQIEALAAKHKDEEIALASVINSLRFDDEASAEDRKHAQNQLVAAVLERDRTIEMLDTFRKEGNAVIQRMHENLRTTAAQNEQLAQRLERQTKEIEELRAIVNGRTEDSGFAAAQDRRIEEYTTLLADADQVIVDLREQNEALHRQMRTMLEQPDGATSSRANSFTTDNSETQRVIDELRDQLRNERRQRLQIEEQSERIWSAQQRQIALLEQRLAAEKRSGGTPRSARAGQRRPSTAFAPASPVASNAAESTPTAASTTAAPGAAAPPSAVVEARPPSPPESRTTAAPSPAADACLSTTDAVDAVDATDPVDAPENGFPDDESEEAHAESMFRIEELQRQLSSLQQTLHA